MKREHPLAAELQAPLQLPFGPETVIEALQPMLTDARLQRIEQVLASRTRAVVPVLDGLGDPHNVAAVLRSSDVFGSQEVHLIEGEEPYLASQRVTQGADRWLDLIRHKNAEDCARSLHARGYRIFVAMMDGDVTPEQLADVPRVAVVFGAEHTGVSKAMQARCDGRYSIPMRGFAESLNVSVAAAITLYAAMRGRRSDLSDADRQALRAQFYWRSVPEAHAILTEHVERKTR